MEKLFLNNESLQSDVNIQQTPGIDSAGAFAIVGSIGAEENALAALIEQEARKLSLLTGPRLNLADFTEISNSIIRALKFILLKNTVLEAKLNETLNFIEREEFLGTDTLENNLIAVIGRIANEELALGTMLAELGRVVIGLAALPAVDTIAELQAIDEIVLTIVKIITEKNLVLLSKLRSIVRFIENNTITFSAAQRAILVGNIAALANSIRVEENGLANIIEGEAAKLERATAIATTAPTVDSVTALVAFNYTVTAMIDVVVQKNMILEAKLEEIISLIGIDALEFTVAELNALAIALATIQQSIANEETALAALIGAEASKVREIIDLVVAQVPPTSPLPPGTIAFLVGLNESVTVLLESITLKNMVLEQKNLDIINFILD